MRRVFIDASVLFSASLSPTGASREIIRLSIQSKIALVANQLVMQEVEKNISIKNSEVLEQLRLFRELLAIELVEPTSEEVVAMLPYTALKDAPHLASAIKAKAHCLVSLDRKHLIDVRNRIESNLELKILLPGELLEEIRRGEEAAQG